MMLIKTYLLMQLEMSERIAKTHNPSRFPSISEQIDGRPSITGPTLIRTAAIAAINTIWGITFTYSSDSHSAHMNKWLTVSFPSDRHFLSWNLKWVYKYQTATSFINRMNRPSSCQLDLHKKLREIVLFYNKLVKTIWSTKTDLNLFLLHKLRFNWSLQLRKLSNIQKKDSGRLAYRSTF